MANDVEKPFGAYALAGRRRQLLRWAQSAPAGWLGRRAALILRKAVLSNGPDIVDATVEGLKYRLYTRDNVSERKFLFMPQFFDPYERARLKQTLFDGGVFVDIGANAGIYTLAAAPHVGAAGKVLAVEPNPAVLERLKFNIALNGFQGRVTVAPVGVSDAEGSFDLVLDDSNLGGSSLVAARGANRITVECRTLRALLAQYGLEKIDALKIDIEGAEDKALAPFFREAPEALHSKLLILENSPAAWKIDLPALLKDKGYALEKTTHMNQVWVKSGQDRGAPPS
ncbi:MAG: FkbM family methyltransferase [Alphaproteobacteria bacterium]|nr:FkbM family methyltransferase [Alphaproteobacteria bacterium]MDE2336497.1 FkbM family methyltransferase [Alphaproteobacteria bacterium]